MGRSVNTCYQKSKSPIVQQYSLDIQRELPGQVGVQVGYVGSLSRHLLPGNTANFNQLPDGLLSLGSQLVQSVSNPYYANGGTRAFGNSTLPYNQLLRPFPEFRSVNLYH